MTKLKTDSNASGRDTITDWPGEAANLRLRSALMDKITMPTQKNGWM